MRVSRGSSYKEEEFSTVRAEAVLKNVVGFVFLALLRGGLGIGESDVFKVTVVDQLKVAGSGDLELLEVIGVNEHNVFLCAQNRDDLQEFRVEESCGKG